LSPQDGPYTQDTGFPLIRTPNIGKGRLILDDVYRVSDETYDIWTQHALPEAGDLILAREAPAGNVAVIKNGQRVCLGQRTVHLRPNPEKVDSDFLCYFLLALRSKECCWRAKGVHNREAREHERHP
jgi:type I restriction enzyme S subunit